AFLARQRHAPGVLEALAALVVRDRHVARQEVVERAEVAGALDVVVSAKRIRSGPGLAEVAREQEEVAYGGAEVGAGDVLGGAHGPARADGLGAGDLARRLPQRFDGDAGGLRSALEGEAFEAGAVLVEAVDAALDEVAVLPALVEDV